MTRHSGQWLPEHSKDFVLIGKIIKSHGLKGEVKVYSYSGSPENFQKYTDLIVSDHKSGACGSFSVKQARVQGGNAILLFEGVGSRNEADILAGREVWLAKSDFPPLGPNEYYWFELEGMEVVTDDGKELGTVTSIFNNKAQDVLVVTGGEREYLIPVTKEIIRHRDGKQRILVISPVNGLLDLNGEEF
jgi:16S rRNA processing protein RimM